MIDTVSWACPGERRRHPLDGLALLRRDHRLVDAMLGRQADIDGIVWTYNTTPRKCLGFLTPIEVFAKSIGVALEF